MNFYKQKVFQKLCFFFLIYKLKIENVFFFENVNSFQKIVDFTLKQKVIFFKIDFQKLCFFLIYKLEIENFLELLKNYFFHMLILLNNLNILQIRKNIYFYKNLFIVDF